MDGVTMRSLAVLTKTPGPRGRLAADKKRLCGPAGRGIRSLTPRGAFYGNPGGADATADAVLETSAAIETLCPTAQSSAGQAAGQEGS